MSIHLVFRSSAAVASALALASCSTSTNVGSGGPGEVSLPSYDVEKMKSLQLRIAALSPTVRPEEAQRIAFTAYTTARRLAREYRVVWPPGLQNFLVHTGARKRGLCFQWAEDMIVPLDALKLETLELHWGESFVNTASEHNVVVVTARGQPFRQGILLDAWRYGGRLYWDPVVADRAYEWTENNAVALRVLTQHRARPSGEMKVTNQERRKTGS